MKLILILLLLFSQALMSQKADSLSVPDIAVKEQLNSEKMLFEENTSQTVRDQLYINEIKKNNNTEAPTITKAEIDLKLKESPVIVEPVIPANADTEIVINEPETETSSSTAPASHENKEKQDLNDLIDQLDDSVRKKKKLIGPSDYDTRIELLQLKPEVSWQLAIFEKSNSVAMIVEKEKVSQVSNEIYTVDISKTLGKTHNLCTGQAFFEQPIVGIGTAFIFSEKTMMTAKHVFERPVKDYIVVFGYHIVQSNGVVEVFFDKNNLYYCTQVKHSADELDVIEFEVDRNFDRAVLGWENSQKTLTSATNEIYMIGHPCGLPMKVALNAAIEKNPHPQYFYTTLDSYQGNSGSPVFNLYTHKVIGVLVSGERDFKFNGNCNYRTKCILPYCKGEKVIRIEEIIKQF